MLIESVLHRIHYFKGFKYRNAHFYETERGPVIKVDLLPRKNHKGKCSKCGTSCPTYDHLEPRAFHFVPLWGFPFEIQYTPRRLTCRTDGIHVEEMPWGQGKSSITNVFKIYLSQWAQKLSWKETAQIFRVGWHHVFESVKYVVAYGLKHRDLSTVKSIGIDEIQYQAGHKYLTLVYQIDTGFRRLLWIGKERKAKTLLRFFRWLGPKKSRSLEAICSDMWKPYLKVIKKKAHQALNILDRFHIMKMFNDAIDTIRRQESMMMKLKGNEDLLHKSRWCLLKNPRNWTETQAAKMKDLLEYNLKSIKAFLLREEFQRFWSYQSAAWAGRFLDSWTFVAARSKIKPIKKIVKNLRKYKEQILNWFRVKEPLSNGIVEGFNGKAKLTMRKSYGFRYYETLEVALYHTLGDLPLPKSTHRYF